MSDPNIVPVVMSKETESLIAKRLTERRKPLEAEVDRLKARVEEMEEKHKAYPATIKKLTEALEKDRSTLAEVEARIVANDAALSSAQMEHEGFSSRIGSARSELIRAEMELRDCTVEGLLKKGIA